MNSFENLPYLDNLALPALDYQYARAIRQPLAHAINQARSQPDEKMNDVIALLEAALTHIHKGILEDEEDSEATSTDDVLDSLLGSSPEDESDAS